MNKKKLLIRLVFLILFIFALNYIATGFYWYFSIWYFDMLMHFLGGFWAGLAVIYVLSSQELDFKLIIKVFLGVLLIGFLWEVFEVSVDKTISQNPFNFLDTVSDIFFDLAGGGLSLIYFSKRIMTKIKNGI
ncbi:hypothetical protein KKA39_02990 [Patescibacteria group bacterium]|nr:hypothetical protein [Patescibacteria group bacterium]MBU1728243.1 hypothetical protein [Patescibacteria group bacterium]